MTQRPFGPLAWTGIALLLGLPALLALLLHPQPSDAWALHPSAGLHQGPWRFWTCAWVHANPRHLAANLAGLALIAGLGWLLRLPPRAALAWGLAWPLTHLALLLDPRLGSYVGLSGVLHAGLSVIATSLIAQPKRTDKWTSTYGWALLLGLLAKCWLENPDWQALLPRPGLDMNVAPMSHWAGALVGIGITLTLSLPKRHGYSQSRP
ncbi:rhombosortase [Aquabacterium sp.]|uniref:rhombosortase n=1 Tax=Aquabacterium sp. TaxID=1872578 RepID=UPI003D6CF257